MAVRGSLWTISAYLAGQALRLGSNIVLAHLLFPEAFALAGLVAIFLQGLEMFSDLGVGTAIVQNPRGDEREFLNTAWTMQVIRGALLWLAACALAWPMSVVYFPQLIELLPVGALAVVFAGLNSTALFTAVRKMAFGRVVSLELASQAVAISVTIVLAWIYRSVWALVIGGLVGAATKMALSHLAMPWGGNRLGWEPAAARALWVFGRWIFVSTAATFLALSADRLLLGKLATADVLGVYMLAFALASVPLLIIGRLSQSVLYSALSQVHRTSPERLESRFRQARSVLLRAGALGVATVVLLSEPFFGIFYDERYHTAGPIAQLIAMAAWFTILQRSGDRLLQAMGQTGPMAAGNVCNLLVTIPSAIVGYRLGGMTGFVLGYAAGNAAGYLTIAMALRLRGVRILGRDVLVTAGGLAVLAGAVWIEHSVADLGTGDNRFLWMGLAGMAMLIGPAIWTAMNIRREVAAR